AKKLLAQMPQNLQDTINKYETLKDYNSPSYVSANDSFFVRHMVVTKDPPAPAVECDGIKGNDFIYNYMWGPTEFNATGTLKNFDRAKDLDQLNLPVLFIAGEFDEARPETMYQFQKMVKNAKVVILEKAGHRLQIDQPVKFPTAVGTFLNSVD
ncbi:MAG: alpha/beta hydrolase, partial [Ginsengibacter sp.]